MLESESVSLSASVSRYRPPTGSCRRVAVICRQIIYEPPGSPTQLVPLLTATPRAVRQPARGLSQCVDSVLP